MLWWEISTVAWLSSCWATCPVTPIWRRKRKDCSLMTASLRSLAGSTLSALLLPRTWIILMVITLSTYAGLLPSIRIGLIYGLSWAIANTAAAHMGKHTATTNKEN